MSGFEEISDPETVSNNPFADAEDTVNDPTSSTPPENAKEVDTVEALADLKINDTSIDGSVDIGKEEEDTNRTPNRGWETEWEDVDKAIKKSITNVSVVSPEVVSSMLSKHVVYSVKTEPMNYIVRRRYNDFAWLCNILSATYHGLFIPSVPATTIFSSNATLSGGSKMDISGDFVKNRMAQLHLFMQQIIKIPFLRSDPALTNFLSVQNEKEFKAMTEAPMSSTPTENWHNMGLSMWFKLVDNTAINPNEADRLINDFKRQLEVLQSTLNQLDKECRAAGRKAVASAAAMTSLSSMVGTWAGVEVELGDVQRNEYIDPYAAAKKSCMESMTSGNNHWAQSIGLIPKVVARVLMSSVQFQMVQVVRFKEHLQMRESLIKDLEKAERERVKALEEKHRAEAAAAEDPASGKRASRKSIIFYKGPEELDENLTKKTDAMTQLQAQVNRLTQGLIFCEMYRFNKDRLESITKLIGTLAATHLQIAQASTTQWSEIVSHLSLDTSQFGDCVGALSSSMDEDVIFSDVY